MEPNEAGEESQNTRCDVSAHACTGVGNSRPVDVRAVRRGAHFTQRACAKNVSFTQVRRDVVRHAQGEGNSPTVDVRGDQNWIEMRGKKVRKTRCDVNAHACTGGQNSRAVDIRRGTHSMQKDKRDSQFCQVRPEGARKQRGVKPTHCRSPKRCPFHVRKGKKQSVSHRCDVSSHMHMGGKLTPCRRPNRCRFSCERQKESQLQAGATCLRAYACK